MKGLRCSANGTRPVKCTFRFSLSHFRARRGGPTLGLARKWSLSKPAIRGEICVQSQRAPRRPRVTLAEVRPRRGRVGALRRDADGALGPRGRGRRGLPLRRGGRGRRRRCGGRGALPAGRRHVRWETTAPIN